MSEKSKFALFLTDMSNKQLIDYAARCSTSVGYLNHLRLGYKIPRPAFMASLALNSSGAVNRSDLLDHFYPDELFKKAA
mgnify:CR=1 FL=1